MENGCSRKDTHERKAVHLRGVQQRLRVETTNGCPQASTHRGEGLRMRRLRQKLPFEIVLVQTFENPLETEAVQVQLLPKIFRGENTPRPPRNETHRTKAVQLRYLQQGFPFQAAPQQPFNHSFRSEAVRLSLLREDLREDNSGCRPRKDSHRRETVHLQRLQQELPTSVVVAETPADPFAGQAAQVRFLREEFREGGATRRSRKETYRRKALHLRSVQRWVH